MTKTKQCNRKGCPGRLSAKRQEAGRLTCSMLCGVFEKYFRAAADRIMGSSQTVPIKILDEEAEALRALECALNKAIIAQDDWFKAQKGRPIRAS